MGRKKINLKFRYDIDWLKKLKITGIVIWPYILFADPPDDVSDSTFRHELQHVYQIINRTPFRFYLTYFWWSIRYKYSGNPFEIDAIIAQTKPLTEAEEKMKWRSREHYKNSQVA